MYLWKDLMKPDYKSYSLEELYDVKDHIDKDKYPERYQELLHEIALREAAVPTSEVIKPKRKRSNIEKIITSAFFFIAAIACIYYGKIPLKHGRELSMDNQPFLFWVTLLILVSLALHQLLTLETKHIKNGRS
jgi:hypothetical protein